MMKNFTEILAPAGGTEQLKAAVRCGANAVYLGTGNFNARRNAENFDGDFLSEAVKYCHSFGVKVYVTLNTLVFDSETELLYETVKEIGKSGADAVIVQDFGVINAVKKICPDLPLHASTQMAVHNLAGAKFLQNLGFTRVVLAREMSLKEIEEVTKNTSLETEVFVHGAHCMSCSGNCYISAMFGERSGNRGKCAQVCRLDWKSRRGNFALSLKDMSYLEYLDKLTDTGVTSFKIEGRMKRPEYVAAAVSSVKKSLNNEPYDKEMLRSVFSRSGFTSGYLESKLNSDMFGYRKKEDVTAAAPVLKSLENLYRTDNGVFKVDMELVLTKDKPSVLTATLNGTTVTVLGDVPKIPENNALSKEIAERNLKKLGGTPFIFGSLKFKNDDGLILSSSSVNALRRSVCEKLTEKLTEVSREVNNIFPQKITPYIAEKTPSVRVRFNSISQYSERFKNIQAAIFPIDEILKNKDSIKNIKPVIFAELPFLVYPAEEEALKNKLTELKELGITDIYCGNIGELYISREAGFAVHGSQFLNITNTASLEFYKKEKLSDTVLSFEMSEKSINALGGELKRGIISYGYIPLMIFRACPQKTQKGCDGCTGNSVLTDRKNISFPLLCHNKKYSVLHNSVPLYTGDKKKMNVDFELIYFTTESKTQCNNIFEFFTEKRALKGNKTSGIYYRELL